MVEAEGKILLAGFEIDPAERAIVDNVIKGYNKKISERIDYDYLKLDMKKSKRGNHDLHEVKGSLKAGKLLLNSSAEDNNLFAAVDEVLGKLLNEAVHKSRTKRQTK